jgi:opacity protein-like surface antigen
VLRYFNHAGGVLILAAAMLSPALAQQAAFHKRFEVGLRVGYMPLKLMRNADATTRFSSFTPPLEVKSTSKPQSRPVTAGPSLVYRFNGKWGLGVDALYRNVGYDELVSTQTIVDAGKTAESYGYTNERTRATFWDVPVLLRYTKYQQKGLRPRTTGMLGVSTRFVTGIESYREIVNRQANVNQTSAPITPARKTAPGATVGLGVEWRDEVGVKVTVEGRYTRWQRDVFRNGPTASTRNTMEVLVGFSF